jgi:hypothetical protein
MHLAHRVLLALGATRVFEIDKIEDPQTEEEFANLQFESPQPITWEQYQEQYPIVERKVGIKQLRYFRDQLLRETDWIMTVDSFQTLGNQAEWVAYRQALRNLPENPPVFKWKETELNIAEMNMPTKPSILRITSSI